MFSNQEDLDSPLLLKLEKVSLGLDFFKFKLLSISIVVVVKIL